jgi:peptide/nickel transport system permease protein
VSIAEAEARGIELEGPPTGLWRDAFRRLSRNPGALVGGIIIALFILTALFAPQIATHNPEGIDLQTGLDLGKPVGFSRTHLLGTDTLGRDEFSRIVYGARYTLLIAVVAVAISLSLGLLIGAIAGFWGGKADSLLMRCVDVMLAIPGLLFAIGLVAVLGPSLRSTIIAVGVVNIPIFARLVRGSILAQREQDYVIAARAVGVKGRVILASHVLPNAISPVIVQATLVMATAIIDVAALGFLGLGPQDPSTPEWGTMLTDANEYLTVAPRLAFIPGLAILISVLAFNLIGDGMREALDPKLRGRV